MKKNIAIVSGSANTGGMEVHILNILQGLSSSFNFYIFCPHGNLEEEYKKYATVINTYPRLDLDPFYILKLVNLFKSLKIDIVHTHELKAGVNGILAAKIAGVPLIVSHQHTPISNWQINPLKKKLNSFIYAFVVNIFSSLEIALTKSIAEQKMQEGIKEGKLKVIPNGVIVPKQVSTRSKSGDFLVGSVGRLTIEKGHNLLIEAFKDIALKEGNEKAKLVLVGDGDLKESLIRQVKSYGLFDRVVFAGRVSEEKKVALYNSFDVFAFPSRAEGFGIVLLEAMSYGIPCVVSDLPVLKDVAGDSVLYFKAGSAKDLEEKLELLIQDKKLRDGLSAKAEEKSKEYSMERFWENYEALYLASHSGEE